MPGNAEFPISLVIRAVDKVGSAFKSVEHTIEKMHAPVEKLGHRFTHVGHSVHELGESVLHLGEKLLTMEGVGAFALYELVKHSVEAGSELATMAKQVGLSVDTYAQLRFAAGQAHISQEEFNTSMAQFNKRLGEAKAGGGPLLKFLNKVSPVLAQQVLHAKDNEAAFGLMARSFEKVTDPAKRAALSAAGFGKGSLQFGQWLGQGSKEIIEQRKRYLELAGSQEKFAESSEEAEKALNETGAAITGLRNGAMTELMPAVTLLATSIADIVSSHRGDLKKWANEASAAITAWINGGGIQRVIAGTKEILSTAGSLIDKIGGFKGALIAVGAVMSAQTVTATAGLVSNLVKLAWTLAVPVLAAIGTFVMALGAGFTAMEALNLAMWMNPVGVIILAVVAAVALLAGAAYLIYKYWTPIKTFFGNLWDGVKIAFTNTWEWIKSHIAEVGEILGAVINPLGAAGGFIARHVFSAGANNLGAEQARDTSTTNNAKVQVDFVNMPRGVRATTDPANTAPVDVNQGWHLELP